VYSCITFSSLLEIISAFFSVFYSLLLIREKKIGWLFGIISSIAGIILFWQTKLYAQSFISCYYTVIGVYGWAYWASAERRNEHIHIWPWSRHLVFIVVFTIISYFFSLLFSAYTDSKSPIFDSFVTSFGLLASFKEARKILTSWVYWLFINIASAILYYQQHLFVYTVLMVVYAFICIPGYLNWLRIYRKHLHESTSP
jgi:nicotinamide mononucleotide transporter